MKVNAGLPNRRAFAKWAAALPTLAAFAAEDMFAKALKSSKYSARENIYTRIGVMPIINARGTWTYMSGSLELPEVREAKLERAYKRMHQTGAHYVVDGIADVLPILDQITTRLAAAERP